MSNLMNNDTGNTEPVKNNSFCSIGNYPLPDKYIYLVDYYNSAIAENGGNEDLFNVELFKAIYGDGKTPADILADSLKGFDGKVIIKLLNEDYADYCKGFAGDSFVSMLTGFNESHDEIYYADVWRKSAFSKEYDVISVLLQYDSNPSVSYQFAKKIAKQLKLSPAFKNVIDIRVCWNCIPVEEYIEHQEMYRRQLLQGFALGDRNIDEFGFDLIRLPENDVSRSGIYVLNFVVKTLIPQVIDHKSLIEHSYSVRGKKCYYYNQPLTSEAFLYKMEPMYFSCFGDMNDIMLAKKLNRTN